MVVYTKLCQGGTCFNNANPNEGIPTNDSGFAQEYSHALAMATSAELNNYPALPMLQVNGQWYFDE